MLPNADYLGTKRNEKRTDKYCCKKCDYSTSHTGLWKKHLNTKKHNADQMLTDADSLGTKRNETDEKEWQCICGKHYVHKQSYYRHKATCTYEPPSAKEADIHNHIVTQTIDKDHLVLELLRRLDEKDKKMDEQQKVITDLVQRVGNHNNISTNSHNTNIILQLNSNYPNALPIQYLIDQIKGNPKCVTHDPKLYAQAFIDALSQQTEDEKTVRAIKDTMYVKYEEIGFKEDKEVQVFDLVKKGTEQDQLCKAAQENSNMFSREKDSKEYPEMVLGITKDLTPCERKLIKKQVIKNIGSE
jgi:hypothetical protein